MPSDESALRVQRLPDIHPVLKAVIVGILAGLVDLAAGPSLFVRVELVDVLGYGITVGHVAAVVLLIVWNYWEVWYR